MQDELARAVAGLPVASLWPLTVPYLARSRTRVAAATIPSALYILAPQIPSISSLLLLLAAIGISLALWSPAIEETGVAKSSWRQRLAESSPVLAALLLGGAARRHLQAAITTLLADGQHAAAREPHAAA